MYKLQNAARSSASFRVRIALNLKGLPFEYIPIGLAQGEHLQPAFADSVPAAALVPVLHTADGLQLTQSMAIMEWLDGTHPDTAPLLPTDLLGKTRVRALAQMIACEIHPLNNLRVLKYLKHDLAQPQAAVDTWYRHWVEGGLRDFEKAVTLTCGQYCYGDALTMADVCLVPQIFNGQRFNCDFSGLPNTLRVFDNLMKLPAFEQAQPKHCPDFV